MSTNAMFDPQNQPFNLLDRDEDPIIVTLGYLNYSIRVGIQQSIVSASQVGAALTILLLVLVLTKPEKRRLPVFWLNCLALFFVTTSQFLACLYYTSSWFSPYAFLTGDYSFVTPAAKALSITGGILAALLVISIEASLVLQVHVVTITLPAPYRLALTLLSTLFALVAIALRLAQLTVNITYNVLRMAYNPSVAPLVQGRDIALAASIVFFSAVFCLKLGWSVRERRRLGLRQFGPMQVVAIGGAQTLVVPALFATLQFVWPTTHIDALVLASVAVSLPLTALWAAARAAAPVTHEVPRFWAASSGGASGKTGGSGQASPDGKGETEMQDLV